MKNIGNFIFSIWLIIVGLSKLFAPSAEGMTFFFTIPRFSLVKPYLPYFGLVAGVVLLVQNAKNMKGNLSIIMVALWTIAINLVELMGWLDTPMAYVAHIIGFVAGYLLIREWQQAQKANLVTEEK